jgi:hypothetical protein
MPILEKYTTPTKNKPSFKIGKFTNLDSTSLKSQAKKEKEKEKYEYRIHDETDEYDLDEGEYVEYYPENENVIIDIHEQNSEDYEDEENIKYYGENNKKFNFYSAMDNVVDILDLDERVSALYDTYVYDKNKQMVFKGNSKDNESLYITKICQTGEFTFRPIGGQTKNYGLTFNNNELRLN